jgi:hypothetical protein
MEAAEAAAEMAQDADETAEDAVEVATPLSRLQKVTMLVQATTLVQVMMMVQAMMPMRVMTPPKGCPNQSNCCYGDKEWFDLEGVKLAPGEEAVWETLILSGN